MYSQKDFFEILFFSLLRYIVFTFQFMLVLKAFDISLPFWEIISAIMLVYLLKSIVPFVNMIGELGLREIASVYVFGLLGQNEINVLYSSLVIWFVNICLPSLIGLFLILKSKFYK